VVIHHREAGDGHGEDLSKFFESVLDPILAVEQSLGKQEGPPHAAGHAVIPASYGSIDEVGTRDRPGWISWDDASSVTTWTTRVHQVPPNTLPTLPVPQFHVPSFRSPEMMHPV